MNEEPKLTGLLIVGRTRFNPKAAIAAAQGAIDRLFAQKQKMEKALLAVQEFSVRLPPEVARQIDAALSISGQ